MADLKTGEIIVNSILIVYAAVIIQMLPISYAQIFSNPIVKLLLLTIILGVSYANPATGILLAIAVLMTIAKGMNNSLIMENMNGTISEEPIEEQVDVEESFNSLSSNRPCDLSSQKGYDEIMTSSPFPGPSGLADEMDFIPEELKVTSSDESDFRDNFYPSKVCSQEIPPSRYPKGGIGCN